MTVETAYALCEAHTKATAKSFYPAIFLLPRKTRQGMAVLYSFCRLCDDAIDEPGTVGEKEARLKEVQKELAAALSGAPSSPLYIALRDVVLRFQVPEKYFYQLLHGVSLDLQKTRYATFSELYDYCYHVASVVGFMSLYIYGFRPEALPFAEALGIGLQLINILRDIREDLERDRIYLPQEELTQFGYSEGELREGKVNQAFRSLMQYQAQRARMYLQQGEKLFPLLPFSSRISPALMAAAYKKTLQKIEAAQFDIFQSKLHFSKKELLLLALTTCLQNLLPLAPQPAS